MKKPLVAVAALVLIVSFLGAYLLLKPPPKPIVMLPNETTVLAKDKNTVSIMNFAFTPSTLRIQQGETVTWINQEATALHSVKSDTFYSGILKTGDSYRFKFSQQGDYKYTDGIHSEMTGEIIVE